MSTALAIGGLVTNIAGTIFRGFSQNRAAQEEAADLRAQAAIEKAESDEEARRLQVQHKKFIAKQGLAFVKGGVSFEGSPLLILQETARESAKEVGAVKRVGQAKYEFGLRKADRVASGGRSALLGGLFDAAGTGFKGFREFQRLGVV